MKPGTLFWFHMYSQELLYKLSARWLSDFKSGAIYEEGLTGPHTVTVLWNTISRRKVLTNVTPLSVRKLGKAQTHLRSKRACFILANVISDIKLLMTLHSIKIKSLRIFFFFLRSKVIHVSDWVILKIKPSFCVRGFSTGLTYVYVCNVYTLNARIVFDETEGHWGVNMGRFRKLSSKSFKHECLCQCLLSC